MWDRNWLLTVFLGCLVATPAISSALTPAFLFDPDDLPYPTSFTLQIDDWVPSIRELTIGWGFRLTEPASLSHLGVFDLNQDGLPASHRVGLWNEGNLIVEATIDSGTESELAGSWRVQSLTTPVTLSPGVYRIGSAQLPTSGFPPDQLFARSEQFMWNLEGGYAGTETDPRITFEYPLDADINDFEEYLVPFQSETPGFQFPTSRLLIQGAYMGPNLFLIPVPEPTTAMMMLAAVAAVVWTRR